MKKIIKFLQDYVNGEDAEAEFVIGWPHLIAVTVIIALVIYIAIKI